MSNKIGLSPEQVRNLLGTPTEVDQENMKRLANLGAKGFKKLSDEQVEAIRKAHDAGEKVRDIADKWGVSLGYVSMVGNGLRRAKK